MKMRVSKKIIVSLVVLSVIGLIIYGVLHMLNNNTPNVISSERTFNGKYEEKTITNKEDLIKALKENSDDVMYKFSLDTPVKSEKLDFKTKLDTKNRNSFYVFLTVNKKKQDSPSIAIEEKVSSVCVKIDGEVKNAYEMVPKDDNISFNDKDVQYLTKVLVRYPKNFLNDFVKEFNRDSQNIQDGLELSYSIGFSEGY